MSRFRCVIGLLAVSVIGGCHTDIVCTRQLAAIEYKCVHIKPIASENPYVGQVLRDVLEKEFIRKKVQMCDANSATVFITGSTFMTLRSSRDAGSLGSRKSAAANQAIESISITATDREGQILLSASYDNREQYTASRLAKEFGAELAKKLK